MSFEFGCAKKLYQKGIHPRLYAGPAEMEVLRERIQSGKGRLIMEALRKKVRPLVRVVEEHSTALPSLLAHHTVRKRPAGGRVLEYLNDMALVGALDKDSRTMEAVTRALLALPAAELVGPKDTYRTSWGNFGIVPHAYDLAFSWLARADRNLLSKWLVEVCVRDVLRELRDSHYLRSAGANTPMVAVISAGVTLFAVQGDAGVPDLADEREELLRYFEAALYSGIGPEGYPDEDIGYGSGMVTLLARVAEAARRAGVYDVYSECPRYAKFGQAMLHFVQPWGKVLSNTGDYGADFGWRSPLFPRLAAETKDPSILWLNGTLSYPIAASGPMDIKERQKGMPEIRLAPDFQVPVDAYTLLTLEDLGRPVHPSRLDIPTQFMDPGRGIVTFRSSWKDDATFLVFDGSQRSCAAQGHAHDSGGHFSLSALGEYFAIDTGRYNIEQDQHNVVLVDGQSGQSTGGDWVMTHYQAVLTGYHPGEFVDTASVNNSQMANCYWSKRTIGLVKDPGALGLPCYAWTVEDLNKANDYHEFWWAMNVHPDHRIVLAGNSATVVGCDHGNMLDVHFALPDPTVYPKPHRLKLMKHIQSCGSSKYIWEDPKKLAREYRRLVGNLQYGPVFQRPRLVGKVSGYNGRFMSIMIPRRKGAKPALVERLPSPENVLAVRIAFGAIEDILIWAYEHNILEAADVKARGQWCVVRRSRKTGKVLASQVAGGTLLSVAGKASRAPADRAG